MFVSSYSTNIQTNTSQKTSKERVDKQSESQVSFASKISKEVPSVQVRSIQLPVDYISKNVVLNNKQELEKQQNKAADSTQDKLNNFSDKNALNNAKSAYETNGKMFSLFKVPNVSINNTPSLDNTLPKEPRDIRELNMRHRMVNTYVANDNYYKVTA